MVIDGYVSDANPLHHRRLLALQWQVEHYRLSMAEAEGTETAAE
jgi:hypothetical protein